VSAPQLTNGAALFSAADAAQYDRHVGRYNAELARSLIAFAGVSAGQTALDVGCGPGALTRELATVLGVQNVVAVDPSPSFVAAARARLPNIDIRVAAAESLPFDDDSFDHVLAQLVVNFMTDARAGVSEMARVTRRGGRVSAATWDYGDGMTFLRRFWDAAVEVAPAASAKDEALTMRHCTPDELRDLLMSAGLANVAVGSAEPRASYLGFEDLWAPIASGIGPAGAFLLSLDETKVAVLKQEYRRVLNVGDGPFELTARAWLASGEAVRARG
jgi:SAM-dependent methyltransferase